MQRSRHPLPCLRRRNQRYACPGNRLLFSHQPWIVADAPRKSASRNSHLLPCRVTLRLQSSESERVDRQTHARYRKSRPCAYENRCGSPARSSCIAGTPRRRSVSGLATTAVGERFEHINHAKSLAEYVWALRRLRGIRRWDRPRRPPGRSPRSARCRRAGRRQGNVPTFVWLPGTQWSIAGGRRRRHCTGVSGPSNSTPKSTPTSRCFARRVIALHRGMLRCYVQMRFLTPAEADYCRNPSDPVVREPIGGVEERGAEPRTTDGATRHSRRSCLRSSPVRSRATSTTPLVARARAELLENRRPAPGRSRHRHRDDGAERAPAVHDDRQSSRGRRKRFTVHDAAGTAMLQSL